VVSHISEYHSSCIFKGEKSNDNLGPLNLENQGNTTLYNVGNYSPNDVHDVLLHHIRYVSSAFHYIIFSIVFLRAHSVTVTSMHVHFLPTYLTLCRSNLKPYCMGRKAAFFSVGI